MDIKEKIFQTLENGNADLSAITGNNIFYKLSTANQRGTFIVFNTQILRVLQELTGQIFGNEYIISINIFSEDLSTLYRVADLIHPLMLIDLGFNTGEQGEVLKDEDTELYYLELQYTTTE